MIRQGVWSAAAARVEEALKPRGATRRLAIVARAVTKTLAIVPDMPTWVQIETTNRCNFSCEMCPRTALSLPDVDMPVATFRGIMERLPLAQGSLITLFGLGEPLMHPDIFTMVAEVKARGFRAAFTTNGTLLAPQARSRILSCGLDYLRISVDDDGFGASDGTLHRAAAAVMERTAALARERGASRVPEILWNVVASAGSAPAIPGIIARAAELGIDGVNLINLVPRFARLAPLPEDRRVDLFRQWHVMGRQLGIRVQSTFGDRFGTRRFFHGMGKECPQLLGYAYVTLDGEVTPCCHLPRVVMGNLLEQPLRDIWHGERFREFRRTYRTTATCRDCRLLTW